MKKFLVERNLELRVRTLALLSTLLLSTLNSFSTQQVINIGTTANDHTGDPNRTAWTKANTNFTELYNFYLGLPVYFATNQFTETGTNGALLPVSTNFFDANESLLAATISAHGLGGANATNVASTNITGILPYALFPPILPPASGANLTFLPASALVGLSAAVQSQTVLSLMAIPATTLTTTTTFGTDFGFQTTSSSTFSGWGEMIGNVTNAFNAVQVQMLPYDVNNIPTLIVVNIRQMPDPSLWAAQNPATWPIIASSGQLPVALPYNHLTHVVAALNGTCSSNLWLEVLANGYWAGNRTLTGVTNGPPWPSYVTTKGLATTNWTSGPTDNSFEFTATFGSANGTITNFTTTALLSSAVEGSEVVQIHLPVNAQNNLYALQGREMNLYFDNVIRCMRPLRDYNCLVTCSKGAQFQNWWRYTPLLADAGTNTLNLAVYTKDTSNLVASATCNLITKSNATPVTPVTRNILMIGDSTMANGNPLAELLALFHGDSQYTLTEIGSNTGTVADSGGTNQTVKCDAISGWSFGFFYTNTTQAWTTIGSVGKTGSPFIFTNLSNNFSFPVFLATNSITMASNDWVLINLGINDFFNYTTDAGVAAGIATNLAMLTGMITNIQNAVSGVRIGLCLTIPPSTSQDGFGVNYPGGQVQWRYRRNHDLWVEALLQKYDQTPQSGVFIVPLNAGLDTVNNMQSAPVALNARNGVSYSQPSNGLHPANSGYYQLADELQMFLKGKEN